MAEEEPLIQADAFTQPDNVMQRQGIEIRSIFGRTPQLLVFFCITALICGLLVINYLSQRSLQQANIYRFQQNFQKSTASIAYFFSERENDITNLAISKPVTGFFSNRNLGMSMTYGLRSSLNSITQLFKHRTASARMGEEFIYSHLSLLDIDGKILSRWPIDETADCQKVPEAGGPLTVAVTSESFGCITFIAPVFLHDKLQGYIQGDVSFDTLTSYLLGDTPGLLFITIAGRLVFQSQPETTILPAALERLGRTDTVWPVELNRDDFVDPATATYAQKTAFTLFFSSLAKYKINLYLAEESSTISRRQFRLLFMAGLGVLSAAVLLGSGAILRANTRNVILETSLFEAGRREKAVAEKVEELELIIDGARLGTWNWDIVSGQVLFNERWMAMLGYDPGQLDTHVDTYTNLVHPDDLEAVRKNLRAHLKGETAVYSVEHRLRHKSGKWIWVLDAGKVLRRDQTGRPLRALGIQLNLTEQKEAQQFLGKAKEESDAIIRNFLDSLIVVDEDLTVSRVNQATCQLLGYSEEELLGQPVTMLFDDPVELVRGIFSFYAVPDSDPLAGRAVLRNVDLSYRSKDGGNLPMSFNISRLQDDAGKITGVVAGAKDISRLMAVLDKVAQQKNYIEKLFDVLPTGLLAIDSSMEIIKTNKAFSGIMQNWAKQFQVTESSLTGELLDKLKKALGETMEHDFALTHNGLTAYLQYNATPIQFPGDIERVVSLRDITDRRKAETARILLATVIEQFADAVIITGTDGVIRYVNPAAIRASGYSRRELLGQKTAILKSNQTDPTLFKELWQTITGGHVWFGRMKSKKKDDTPVEEDVTISPVRNEEGDITNYVAIKRDVTKIDLLQKQLLKAQKMETIGQLAAGIAHEINTPMQYVQNNVTFLGRVFEDISVLVRDYRQLLQTPGIKLSDEAVKHLAEIDLDFLMAEIPQSVFETHGGINRVVKIVAALKEFSHPGSQAKTLIDVNHTIENTITVSRNEWKYVAEVVTDFDPELPLVCCQPDQLSQALLNLIVNSGQAIAETGASVPDNPGRIGISTRHRGDFVEIRVSDSGGGIPEEIHNRIFDPFFTTKEVGKGTGQGLSIAHAAVVQKHGGSLDFISEPGKGTTFILRLPIKTIENNKGLV